MGLERDLAEIQVLTSEIEDRAKSSIYSEVYFKDMNFVRSLSGIKSDATTLMDKYRSARKASDELEKSRFIAEFALDAKNLADNLNVFLQSLYGEDEGYNGKLKDLRANTSDAPLLESGESFVDRHNQVHKYGRDSPLIQIRNMKGHGEGHMVINGSQDHLENNSYDWLNSQARSYLGMTRDILRTIADKEEERLSVKKKRKSVGRRRLENIFGRHKVSLAIGGITAAVVGGIIGGMAISSASEKNRQIYEGDQITNLLQAIHIDENEAFYTPLNLGENSFNKTLKDLKKRSQSLGRTADVYANAIHGPMNNYVIVNQNFREDESKKLISFFEERDSFKVRLENLEYSPTVETVSELSSLLKEERRLSELETKVSWAVQRFMPKEQIISAGTLKWKPREDIDDILKSDTITYSERHFLEFKREFIDRTQELGDPVEEYLDKFDSYIPKRDFLGEDKKEEVEFFLKKADFFKRRLEELVYRPEINFVKNVSGLLKEERHLYEEQKEILENLTPLGWKIRHETGAPY